MSIVGAIESRAVSLLRERQEHVELIRAIDLPMQEIEWLWPGWLARAKLHLLAGDAGTGKTTLAIAIAALVSSGRSWPDGSAPPVGNVLIWSGEDDAADTIVPRLMAAGADLERVFVVGDVCSSQGARPFDPSQDLAMLEKEAARIGDVALLIVDPIVSTVSGDGHKNAEVRRSLQPLVDLATNLRCAVLGIAHFSKAGMGIDPLLRVTGSVAFGAVARVVCVAAKRRGEEDRVFCRAKSNIGPDEGGFAYRITLSEGAFSASFVSWGEPMEGAARDLIADSPGPTAGDGESAKSWLQDLLGAGPIPVSSIESEAAQRGYAWRTLERVKKSMGIRSSRDGPDGGWRWSMPALEDRQHRHVGDGGVGGVAIGASVPTNAESEG